MARSGVEPSITGKVEAQLPMVSHRPSLSGITSSAIVPARWCWATISSLVMRCRLNCNMPPHKLQARRSLLTALAIQSVTEWSSSTTTARRSASRKSPSSRNRPSPSPDSTSYDKEVVEIASAMRALPSRRAGNYRRQSGLSRPRRARCAAYGSWNGLVGYRHARFTARGSCLHPNHRGAPGSQDCLPRGDCLTVAQSSSRRISWPNWLVPLGARAATGITCWP